MRNSIPEARLKEAFQICQEGIMSGHRGVNDTLDKFQKTFFVLCTWDKIRRLVERCDICLTKERSIKPMMGPHVPSTVGNVWEIVYEIVSVFDIDSLWDCAQCLALIVKSCTWIDTGLRDSNGVGRLLHRYRVRDLGLLYAGYKI